MYVIPRFRRMMRSALRVMLFIRDCRGSVLIEMAFCIPLLALIGFGGLEMANLTLANSRISQIALSAADNASRIAVGSNLSLPRVREVDINEVFTGVEEQAHGLQFKQNARVILSSLERNKDGGQWIHWQRCYGSLAKSSSFGVEGTGATGKSFVGMGPAGQEVTAAAGTAVMFVEVYYTYQPLAYGGWLGPRTIHTIAAYNIREARDLTQVYNPSPAATKSAC